MTENQLECIKYINTHSTTRSTHLRRVYKIDEWVNSNVIFPDGYLDNYSEKEKSNLYVQLFVKDMREIPMCKTCGQVPVRFLYSHREFSETCSLYCTSVKRYEENPLFQSYETRLKAVRTQMDRRISIFNEESQRKATEGKKRYIQSLSEEERSKIFDRCWKNKFSSYEEYLQDLKKNKRGQFDPNTQKKSAKTMYEFRVNNDGYNPSELGIKNILDKLGIKHLSGSNCKTISGHEVDLMTTSRFMLDFYLPDYNLCIEADGSIHNSPERKEHDQKRDNILKEKLNIDTLRIDTSLPSTTIEHLILTELASRVPCKPLAGETE